MIADEQGRRDAIRWHEVREAELVALVTSLVGVVRSHTSLTDADLVVRVPAVAPFVGHRGVQEPACGAGGCRVVQLPPEAPVTVRGAAR